MVLDVTQYNVVLCDGIGAVFKLEGEFCSKMLDLLPYTMNSSLGNSAKFPSRWLQGKRLIERQKEIPSNTWMVLPSEKLHHT